MKIYVVRMKISTHRPKYPRPPWPQLHYLIRKSEKIGGYAWSVTHFVVNVHIASRYNYLLKMLLKINSKLVRNFFKAIVTLF